MAPSPYKNSLFTKLFSKTAELPIFYSHFKKTFFVANALFWSTIFFQPAIAASTTDALVKEKVDALFRPGSIWEKKCAEKKSSVGIQVVSMGTRKSVYSHNHKKHFIPASNIKLITTVAALKTLSPQYRFRTEVFYDGSLDQGVLKGNLYVKGYGDPHMVSEELWLLVRELRSKGIGKISGDVIGDDTFFDDERYGNGWRPSTNSRAYSAELGALSLNFNSIKVYIDSFEAPEKKPVVLLDPPTDYIDVQNRILSDKRTKKANLTLKRVFSQNKNVVFAKGVVPRENKRRTYYRNISNPPLYFVTVFTEFLKTEGITVTGKPRVGKLNDGLTKLVEHKSKPLSLIVRGLNKFSNNFVAEQILKTMGAELFSPPGTTEKGLQIMHRYLKSIGLKRADYTLVGASGYSRQNRFTPDQLVSVLTDAYNNFKIRSEVVSSLSVLGRDGSLKHRYISPEMSQQVRGKTGTLSGVTALSGFMGTRSGDALAFSILMNDFRCTHAETWDIQNQVLESMFNL